MRCLKEYIFPNGVKYGDIVLYNPSTEKVFCMVQFELYIGKPVNLRLLPLKSSTPPYYGRPISITEFDLLNSDTTIKMFEEGREDLT